MKEKRLEEARIIGRTAGKLISNQINIQLKKAEEERTKIKTTKILRNGE